jgi:hypothetical protein
MIYIAGILLLLFCIVVFKLDVIAPKVIQKEHLPKLIFSLLVVIVDCTLAYYWLKTYSLSEMYGEKLLTILGIIIGVTSSILYIGFVVVKNINIKNGLKIGLVVNVLFFVLILLLSTL